MIKAIAVRVIRENVAGRIFRYYIIGLFTLLFIATLDFAYSYDAQYAMFHSRYEAIGSEARLTGTTALMPPNWTGFISRADEEILPTEFGVTAGEAAVLGGGRQPKTYLYTRVRLDWQTIIGIWVSLAALMFSFDAISGERRSNNLKLQLSYGVTRFQFLVGKLAGMFLTVYIPVVALCSLSLLVATAHIASYGAASAAPAILATGLAAFLLGSVYCLAFLMIGVVFSCVFTRPSSSLLATMLLWTTAVWIWPPMSLMIGERLHQIPSYREASAEWLQLDYGPSFSLSSGDLSPIVDSDLPEGEKQARLDALAAEIEEATERSLRESRLQARARRSSYIRRQWQQTDLARRLMTLSPYGLFKSGLEALSVSGFERHKHFVLAADRFSRGFGAVVEQKRDELRHLATFHGSGSVTYRGYKLSVAYDRNYDEVEIDGRLLPTFRWERPPLWNSVGKSLLATGWLILLSATLFLIALRQLSRMEIT